MVLTDDANGTVIADAIRITRDVDLGYTAFIQADHLATPQKMTDATGAVIWDRTQRPFGATESETGPSATNIRFPGQYADAESGLHYNNFRDYAPSLGLYVKSDPVGLRGGLNTYGYVKGNPLVYAESYGLIVVYVSPGATTH